MVPSQSCVGPKVVSYGDALKCFFVIAVLFWSIETIAM